MKRHKHELDGNAFYPGYLRYTIRRGDFTEHFGILNHMMSFRWRYFL